MSITLKNIMVQLNFVKKWINFLIAWMYEIKNVKCKPFLQLFQNTDDEIFYWLKNVF